MSVLWENEDIRQLIFSYITCIRVLHRARSTCRDWCEHLSSGIAGDIWQNAWLTVPIQNPETGEVLLSVEHALARAPAGERICIAEGTRLRGQVLIGRPVHVRCEANVVLTGRIVLGDERSFMFMPHYSKVASLVVGDASSSAAAESVGVIDGLACMHFESESFAVDGGAWRLANCKIDSLRRQRAGTAVIVRNGGALGLIDCTINDAKHGVCLERANCAVHARGCKFENVKEGAVVTRGGGSVTVARSTFEGEGVTGLKLDALVRGHARQNTFGPGAQVFGRWAKPDGFRVFVGNTFADDEQREEAEEEVEEEEVPEQVEDAKGESATQRDQPGPSAGSEAEGNWPGRANDGFMPAEVARAGEASSGGASGGAAANSAGSSASVGSAQCVDRAVWTCAVCTYDNIMGRCCCEMCDSERPPTPPPVARAADHSPQPFSRHK